MTNALTTADIVAGDSMATTVTSAYKANGAFSLSGLDQNKFLMVLDMKNFLPTDGNPSDYYVGWWNAAANDGAGAWQNAVLGNHGTAGSLAGFYAESYQKFLSDHGGWDSTTMLGAYGADLANGQVWAVINHNSDFGVTTGGILVPEPGTCTMVLAALAGSGHRLLRRRKRDLRA